MTEKYFKTNAGVANKHQGFSISWQEQGIERHQLIYYNLHYIYSNKKNQVLEEKTERRWQPQARNHCLEFKTAVDNVRFYRKDYVTLTHPSVKLENLEYAQTNKILTVSFKFKQILNTELGTSDLYVIISTNYPLKI